MSTATATTPMLTPPQVARRLGVKAQRVRAWIRSGELKAANLSDATRPRYRVDPIDLQIFLQRRSAGPAPKVSRRRRDSSITEFF